jgi:flagellar hook-associated protein FlgK
VPDEEKAIAEGLAEQIEALNPQIEATETAGKNAKDLVFQQGELLERYCGFAISMSQITSGDDK